MAIEQSPLTRAMTLAAISGLKAMMGPALVASAGRRPERNWLALAAMGEMVLDKLPILPSRSSLPLLLPRAAAGYWSAKISLEREGIDDQKAALMGAAVAAGVAVAAPKLRFLLNRVLGIPDMAIGAAEDYFALKVGAEAVGLSIEDLKAVATEAIGEAREQVSPAVEQARERFLPAH